MFDKKELLYRVWFARVEISNKVKRFLLDKYTEEEIFKFDVDELSEKGLRDNQVLKILDVKYKNDMDEVLIKQISEGIKYFNASQSVDVIIVGRGGGSMEDLWAFNDEGLARCVASSEIPIISAVGHETDFTICDFAADLRAPTPSAAAELAVPDTEDIKRRLENVNVRNRTTIESRLTRMKQRLDYISKLGVLSTPDRLLDQRRMNVIYFSEKLKNGAVGALNEEKIKFSGITQKLEALNPLSIISRGYSVVTDTSGRVVKTVSHISEGDRLNIRFSDGEVQADVKKVIPG
jgi:exodeoxyribonuclease VII large subunit